jgi:hypothetical protein
MRPVREDGEKPEEPEDPGGSSDHSDGQMRLDFDE